MEIIHSVREHILAKQWLSKEKMQMIGIAD